MKERRQHPRIEKSFVLSYFDKDHPNDKHEITQVKNISAGGLCFVTSHFVKPSTKIALDLKTPYLAATLSLEGVTLASQEKIKGMIYETRLEFNNLSNQSQALLDKIIEIFMEKLKAKND